MIDLYAATAMISAVAQLLDVLRRWRKVVKPQSCVVALPDRKRTPTRLRMALPSVPLTCNIPVTMTIRYLRGRKRAGSRRPRAGDGIRCRCPMYLRGKPDVER
jgi:hypothetical protein